ncbi:hypothetical protein MASR2M41_00340 [Flammeovirgaceae bacterium]
MAIFLTGWDIHQSLYGFVWDYQLVRLYALVSISLFITINGFRLIEVLILKIERSTSASNLSGFYGYVLGTIIYIVYLLFIQDYSSRVFGLAIPILLTILGFNYFESAGDKKQTRMRLILLINIVILLAWSITVFNLYVTLQYDRDSFDDGKKYFTELEKKYFSNSDSLARVYSKVLSPKVLDRIENDTLKSILYNQMDLFLEFKTYRESISNLTYSQYEYIWKYNEMRTMIGVGLIFVLILNAIYLTYLIKV